MLQPTGIRLVPAFVLTACLGVILIGWRRWSMRGGMIAVSIISVGQLCLTWAVSWPLPWNDPMQTSGVETALDVIIVLSCAFFIGSMALYCLIAAAHLVDWLESLGRKSRPPDP